MSDDDATVAWRRGDRSDVAAPVVEALPYAELKLRHPSLDATAYGDQFHPDAVPYECGGARRVFYWTPALESAPPVDDWRVACATTHGLAAFAALPGASPPLVAERDSGTEVVVTGTVAGETTTATLASYAPPAVELAAVGADAVEVTVDGATHAVPVGERRPVRLPEQTVRVPDSEDGAVTVAPELVVRYPGERELHHPAVGESYRLFPSFGLDLDDVPNPLSVPTTAGELAHADLADRLAVDLDQRPYAERVLWQAFAFAAFDPHADEAATLTRLPDGHLAVA